MMPELFIKGEASKKAFNQLQQATNLSLTMDSETGQVTATGKAKTDDDKQLLSAINSTDITINITAKSTNEISPGVEAPLGGSFLGNKIDVESTTIVEGTKPYNPVEVSSKKVTTEQFVNPNFFAPIDSYYETPGRSMLHEVTESFEGEKISLQKGVSKPPAGSSGTVYEKAHNAATTQPPIFGRAIGLKIQYYLSKEGKNEIIIK